MKTNTLRNALAFTMLALFGFANAANAQYTITPLPANLTGYALNNNGQILGSVGSSIYLITNGVQQLVSDAYFDYYFLSFTPALNQNGQVAGVDSAGNLFLYSNGAKQIIEQNVPHDFGIIKLTDSGELIWGEYVPAAKSYTMRIYQNGVVQDIGEPAVSGYVGANNLGQILDGNYLYTNGAWTAPAHLNGGRFINNKGQILTTTLTTTQFGFYKYAMNIGIYDIATDSSYIAYSISYDYYAFEPNVTSFNDEGDFIGYILGPGPSSSPQHAGFGLLHGKYRAFGTLVPDPRFDRPDQGSADALNNHGDVTWFKQTSNACYVYHADTDTSEITNSAFYQGIFLNDNDQFVLGDRNFHKAYSFWSPTALTSADSVSGVATLEGEALNAPAQTVTFEFRDVVSHQTLFTRAASVLPYGGFTVSGVPVGSYNLRVKSPKNLAQAVDIVKASGALSGVSVFLPAGDANNDNFCDAADFGLFISAYNTDASVPGSGYDPTCDFSGDGFVDPTDFGLLVGNYNTQGDF